VDPSDRGPPTFNLGRPISYWSPGPVPPVPMVVAPMLHDLESHRSCYVIREYLDIKCMALTMGLFEGCSGREQDVWSEDQLHNKHASSSTLLHSQPHHTLLSILIHRHSHFPTAALQLRPSHHRYTLLSFIAQMQNDLCVFIILFL